MEKKYSRDLRLKAGLKRFLKGLGAALAAAVLGYAIEFVSSNPELIPEEAKPYVLGLVVPLLLGLEKLFQKDKNKK